MTRRIGRTFDGPSRPAEGVPVCFYCGRPMTWRELDELGTCADCHGEWRLPDPDYDIDQERPDHDDGPEHRYRGIVWRDGVRRLNAEPGRISPHYAPDVDAN